MIYGIISDVHCHNWSAFSESLPNGMNSRLGIILGEVKRAAEAVHAAGGKTLFVSGDLFHVRGSVAPSVLNPTMEVFSEIGQNMDVIIIPGNHDLEGKNTNELGSAVTALGSCHCMIVSEPNYWSKSDASVAVVPWFEDLEQLKAEIKMLDIGGTCRDLIIHAPIDGMLNGVPAHGLHPSFFYDLGFKRVFAGHYHNHNVCPEGIVWSVGAIAHHTWSDVGSKAGFVIVDTEKDEVKFHASRAPKFITITAGKYSDEELPLVVDGNYVRVELEETTSKEVEEVRKLMMDNGAAGVIIKSIKRDNVVARATTAIAAKSETTRESVNNFVKATVLPSYATEVAKLCDTIMSEVESVE